MTNTNRAPLQRMLLASIYLLWAASGVTQGLSFPPGWLLWLQAVLAASAMTIWCSFDAAHRGQPLLPVMQMLLFLTWPIGVPIYLLKSRGWKGLILAVSHAGAMLTVYGVALTAVLMLQSR